MQMCTHLFAFFYSFRALNEGKSVEVTLFRSFGTTYLGKNCNLLLQQRAIKLEAKMMVLVLKQHYFLVHLELAKLLQLLWFVR